MAAAGASAAAAASSSNEDDRIIVVRVVGGSRNSDRSSQAAGTGIEQRLFDASMPVTFTGRDTFHAVIEWHVRAVPADREMVWTAPRGRTVGIDIPLDGRLGDWARAFGGSIVLTISAPVSAGSFEAIKYALACHATQLPWPLWDATDRDPINRMLLGTTAVVPDAVVRLDEDNHVRRLVGLRSGRHVKFVNVYALAESMKRGNTIEPAFRTDVADSMDGFVDCIQSVVRGHVREPARAPSLYPPAYTSSSWSDTFGAPPAYEPLPPAYEPPPPDPISTFLPIIDLSTMVVDYRYGRSFAAFERRALAMFGPVPAPAPAPVPAPVPAPAPAPAPALAPAPAPVLMRPKRQSLAYDMEEDDDGEEKDGREVDAGPASSSAAAAYAAAAPGRMMAPPAAFPPPRPPPSAAAAASAAAVPPRVYEAVDDDDDDEERPIGMRPGVADIIDNVVREAEMMFVLDPSTSPDVAHAWAAAELKKYDIAAAAGLDTMRSHMTAMIHAHKHGRAQTLALLFPLRPYNDPMSVVVRDAQRLMDAYPDMPVPNLIEQAHKPIDLKQEDDVLIDEAVFSQYNRRKIGGEFAARREAVLARMRTRIRANIRNSPRPTLLRVRFEAASVRRDNRVRGASALMGAAEVDHLAYTEFVSMMKKKKKEKDDKAPVAAPAAAPGPAAAAAGMGMAAADLAKIKNVATLFDAALKLVLGGKTAATMNEVKTEAARKLIGVGLDTSEAKRELHRQLDDRMAEMSEVRSHRNFVSAAAAAAGVGAGAGAGADLTEAERRSIDFNIRSFAETLRASPRTTLAEAEYANLRFDQRLSDAAKQEQLKQALVMYRQHVTSAAAADNPRRSIVVLFRAAHKTDPNHAGRSSYWSREPELMIELKRSPPAEQRTYKRMLAVVQELERRYAAGRINGYRMSSRIANAVMNDYSDKAQGGSNDVASFDAKSAVDALLDINIENTITKVVDNAVSSLTSPPPSRSHQDPDYLESVQKQAVLDLKNAGVLTPEAVRTVRQRIRRAHKNMVYDEEKKKEKGARGAAAAAAAVPVLPMRAAGVALLNAPLSAAAAASSVASSALGVSSAALAVPSVAAAAASSVVNRLASRMQQMKW